MKKRLCFIAAIIIIATTLLVIIQTLLSLQIKQKIKSWTKEQKLEISDFRCNLNLLTGKINFKNLTLKQANNDFKVKKGYIAFKLLDFLSNKNIKGIYINEAEVKLENFIPFSFPNMTKKPTCIDKIEIKNLNLQIGPSNGNNITDINIFGYFENIGTNKDTVFLVNASSNSSFMEIKGNFDCDDWKKRLAYQVLGEDVSLEIINVLEEGFLSSKIREQLLSLYLKDILMVKLHGKMDIVGNGEINEQNIDSKLNFLVSELSCETDNERIKSLVKKISSNGEIQINYKIYGTTSNPYLTYDISF